MVVVVLVSRCAHMQGRRHVRMLCITQILHSVSHGLCPTGEYSRPMGVGALRKVGGADPGQGNFDFDLTLWEIQ